jgi:hypothetical protein
MKECQVIVTLDNHNIIKFNVVTEHWLNAVSMATEYKTVKKHSNYKMTITHDNIEIKVNRINGKLEILE